MAYLPILFILIAAAAVVVWLARKTASHPFKCRHCARVFSIRWQKVLVTGHSGREYKLLCPGCKVRDWCEELTGQSL